MCMRLKRSRYAPADVLSGGVGQHHAGLGFERAQFVKQRVELRIAHGRRLGKIIGLRILVQGIDKITHTIKHGLFLRDYVKRCITRGKPPRAAFIKVYRYYRRGRTARYAGDGALAELRMQHPRTRRKRLYVHRFPR